ncbi:MAG TPA: hypothetical protein HPQ04_06180 [Rhodospirillaceae bacterium]|nr:hypothetical protein [Rhodospirillaceae bacterium]
MAMDINSVAVIGGGTMGSGIAAACAAAGRRVLLLEVDAAAAAAAWDRALATAAGEDERARMTELIRCGTVAANLTEIAGYDWICEAVAEDLEAKRRLFAELEPLRRDGSVVSTNTSGIPLRAITAGMPARLRRDIVVTHFFNPVRVMRLLEIVAGEDTRPEVRDALAGFCRDVLGKGIVHAKDTVNFIGNRIGCFWMLSGLHKAKTALAQGLSMERVDALMGLPVGLPSTGLYGLIDLIGLDVMDFVGKNLEINLPPADPGRAFTSFPAVEQAMLDRGQLGRKSGGGFYRMVKLADGGKRKEVFDVRTEAWRAVEPAVLADSHADSQSLFLADDAEGRFTFDLMGGTLLYAADLVGEIADDIVNVDRAMRWGFAWKRGPFELLDAVGPARLIERLLKDGHPLPHMLAVLRAAGVESFYRDGEFLGLDGVYRPVPV